MPDDGAVKLEDAVVLVTGSGRGIGEACAAGLQRRGAHVILHARNPDGVGRVAAQLGAKTLSGDLRERTGAERLAELAHDVYGRIDAVVHCAGVGWYGPTTTMDPDRLAELLEVNLRAPLLLTRALLPGMVGRGSGHISFVASIAGLTAVNQEAVYAASKAGLVTFAESLRLELAGSGVGVSVVSPAAVRTEFFASRGAPYGRRIPRPVPAARVANAVLRGIERERASQTVPRWVGVAPAVRGLSPALFRVLNQRLG